MNNRAYSLLRVRSIDDEQRVIEGIATTPQVDRVGDIVEPLGIKFALPMPLLLGHDHEKPVGKVFFAEPTAAGIPFKARLPKVDEPGTLKDRVDEAWHSVKHGLLAAVSIGFRTIDGAVERLSNGGLRFLESEWIELSLCAVPANPDAKITGIKALDTELRSTLARRSDPRPHRRGAPLKKQRDIGPLVRAVGGAIKEHVGKAFRALADRIDLLEQQRDVLLALADRVEALEQRKSFEYRGVYSEDEQYEPDDFVTHDGSLWHTDQMTRSRPGTPGGPWQLCVKRGRDAR